MTRGAVHEPVVSPASSQPLMTSQGKSPHTLPGPGSFTTLPTVSCLPLLSSSRLARRRRLGLAEIAPRASRRPEARPQPPRPGRRGGWGGSNGIARTTGANFRTTRLGALGFSTTTCRKLWTTRLGALGFSRTTGGKLRPLHVARSTGVFEGYEGEAADHTSDGHTARSNLIGSDLLRSFCHWATFPWPATREEKVSRRSSGCSGTRFSWPCLRGVALRLTVEAEDLARRSVRELRGNVECVSSVSRPVVELARTTVSRVTTFSKKHGGWFRGWGEGGGGNGSITTASCGRHQSERVIDGRS